MKRRTRTILISVWIAVIGLFSRAEGADIKDLDTPHRIDSANDAFNYMKMPRIYKDLILFHAVPKGSRPGVDDLFIIRRDGSGLVRLTKTPRYSEQGYWVKSGKIVYSQKQGAGPRARIVYYIMNSDGTGKQKIEKNLFDFWISEGPTE